MKCVILAGGFGDRLWPLSRKNFPKQFLNLDGGNSLFQNTIIRNMPYCDKFYIVTHVTFNEIVEGQMKQFQGVSYEILLEQETRGTAPAIEMVSRLLPEDEELLITPADLFIHGDGYSEAIYKAKPISDEGKAVLFGVPAEEPSPFFGYICFKKNEVVSFIEKPCVELATELFQRDDIYWNSGMILCRNEFLRREYEKYAPSYMNQTERIHIEKVILEQSKSLGVVPLSAQWSDVSNFDTYKVLAQEEQGKNVICSACENTSVINANSHQLVVANHLKDVYVVNTNDAIYITDKSSEENIKRILEQKADKYLEIIDNLSYVYRQWGIREQISQDQGYRVKKVLLYAGKSMSKHRHEKRNENYSVIKGILSVELEDGIHKIHAGESINVLPKQIHRLYNDTPEDVVAIEVDTGEEILEHDMIHVEEGTNRLELPHLYRLAPAYKDYLWGGNRLAELFREKSPYEITAESWKLSAHKDGQSRIIGGAFHNEYFGDFVEKYGKKICGWKSQSFHRFPILIKFIDAQKALSVQVHPFDDYAFVNENEFGKNEVWYVMDAKPGAYLYCGFAKNITKEELEQRLKDNSILEVLNKVEVKKGDVLFIPSGTIHAIGEGILICEIQQNSNSTYRVYDYNRKDREGNLRPLHIKKALDVLSTEAYHSDSYGWEAPVLEGSTLVQKICLCKYFECTKYDISEESYIYMDDSSFVSLVFLEGEAMITCQEERKQARAGDSFFVSSGRKVLHIKGRCSLIVTNI